MIALDHSQHLSLLAKVITRKSITRKHRPRNTKIELQLLNQKGKLLARNKVYSDAQWHRVLLIPQFDASLKQNKQVLTFKVIDQDSKAYIMIDDIKIDQALDL